MRTRFEDAIRTGDTATVCKLLDAHGPKVVGFHVDGERPAFVAVNHGRWATLRRLVFLGRSEPHIGPINLLARNGTLIRNAFRDSYAFGVYVLHEALRDLPAPPDTSDADAHLITSALNILDDNPHYENIISTAVAFGHVDVLSFLSARVRYVSRHHVFRELCRIVVLARLQRVVHWLGPEFRSKLRPTVLDTRFVDIRRWIRAFVVDGRGLDARDAPPETPDLIHAVVVASFLWRFVVSFHRVFDDSDPGTARRHHLQFHHRRAFFANEPLSSSRVWSPPGFSWGAFARLGTK